MLRASSGGEPVYPCRIANSQIVGKRVPVNFHARSLITPYTSLPE